MILNKTNGFHISQLELMRSLSHQAEQLIQGMQQKGRWLAGLCILLSTQTLFLSPSNSALPSVLYIRLHTHLLAVYLSTVFKLKSNFCSITILRRYTMFHYSQGNKDCGHTQEEEIKPTDKWLMKSYCVQRASHETEKYLGTGLSHKNIFHFNDIDFEYLIFLFSHTYLRMIRGQNQIPSSHLISKTLSSGEKLQ